MVSGGEVGWGLRVYAGVTPGVPRDSTSFPMNCHSPPAGIDRGSMVAGAVQIPVRPIVAIRLKPAIGARVNEIGIRFGLPASFAGVSKETSR
jgi:hypothetical protein